MRGNGLPVINKRGSNRAKPTHKVDYVKEHTKGSRIQGEFTAFRRRLIHCPNSKGEKLSKSFCFHHCLVKAPDSIPAKAKLATQLSDELFWIKGHFYVWKSATVHLEDGIILVEEENSTFF